MLKILPELHGLVCFTKDSPGLRGGKIENVEKKLPSKIPNLNGIRSSKEMGRQKRKCERKSGR